MTEIEQLEGDEFEDRAEHDDDGFDGLDLSTLWQPVTTRTLGGAALAGFALFWPNLTGQVLARVLAGGLLLVGITTLWSYARTQHARRIDLATGLAAVAAAAVVQFSTVRTEFGLGRLLGATLMCLGLRELWFVRRASAEERAWLITRSGAALVLGGLLVLYPVELLSATISLLALGWLFLAGIVIAQSATTSTDTPQDSRALIGQWLTDRPKAADDRQSLYAKILYEGTTTRLRVSRFFTLMGFASVIASMGVVTSSTAVVIGAMLIAPLMTPLMGMAISLVMGWPNRLRRSATIAGLGIVWAITIGLVLGLLFSSSFDVATNSQIQARISPTMLDLVIAIAAGAAGAFGLSRPDVSDSLPGVAIAISLVPPLTVVGLCYSAGAWSAGNGALLLFLTNAVAILIVGGLTFIVTGVTPVARIAANQHRMRTTLVALATFALLIIGGLLLNGAEIAGNALEKAQVDEAVETWLVEHPDHEAVQARLLGDRIEAVVIGPSDAAPQPDDLANLLAEALNRDITADVRLVVEERSTASSTG